ncbi:hypothetical protein U1Q18_049122, partial [Sarracenia purpurea var. burkii]
MLSLLTQDDRIVLWRTPAQQLLRTEEVHSEQYGTTKRPAVDENRNLIPEESKFFYAEKYGKYYVALQNFNAIAAAMREELKQYKAKAHKPRAKGQLRSLFNPEDPINKTRPVQDKITRILKNENSVQVLRRVSVASEASEYETASENEAEPVRTFEETKNISDVFAMDALDNTKVVHPSKLEPIVKAQIITKDTKDPTCVVPLLVENMLLAAQLDTGALPNVISK